MTTGLSDTSPVSWSIPTLDAPAWLYRQSGWHEIARVSFDLGDLHLNEIVFVGPTA